MMASNASKIKWWQFGLAAVLILVVLKVTMKTGDHSITRLRAKVSNLSGVRGASSSPESDGNGFMAPGKELDEYCERYRWKPFPDRRHRRKIYNIIPINDELEWLEIRLGEMSSSVDYFVIIESPITFTEMTKPLHVRENWARFAQYHSKMILHTLNVTGQEFSDAWGRESFNKNAGFLQAFPTLTGEQTPRQGDVILVGDVDELVRPSVLRALRNCDFPQRLRLHTKIYYYSFQWLSQGQGNGNWVHPDVTYFDTLDTTILPESIRNDPTVDEVWNAGWHCSFCFPRLQQIVNKVKSFSHTEMQRPEILDPQAILQRVRTGLDVFAREGSDCHRTEEYGDLPGFLLKKENSERFKYVLDRDPVHGNFLDYEDAMNWAQ